ncbi:MAG TPA: MG2 domain-containing protein [Sphingobacterium sp.]|nr:MG2 domain-containing protein [Sphingobacterium sp.]
MKIYIWFLLCLAPLFAVAQESTNATTDAWREVERLIDLKNYAQTLPLLAEIKATAKKNNNSGEWIRAVLAESQSLRINNTDNSTFVETKQHFEQHISQANTLERAVLQNFYAQYLYSNINRFLSERADPFIAQNVAGKTKIIDQLFSLSLFPKDVLTHEPIQKWQDMFVEQRNLSLTPTLFHFLAHQYLNFLQFAEKGEQSAKTTALTHELAQLNRTGEYSDATAYLLSYRLAIHSWNIESELQKYLAIINKQKSDYNAFLLYQVANAYQENNPKEAIKYIDIALRDYPKSPWINNIKNLANTIKKANIILNHDRFAPAQLYSPVKISAKNVDTLYIRVYNTTNHPKNKNIYTVKYDSISFQVSLDASLAYEEKIVLKKFDDYTAHTTIYKINPLPYGNYTILLANNPAFEDDGLYKDVTQSQISITDVFLSATIDKKVDKHNVYKTLLINRKTGAPFGNKKVQLYETSKTAPPRLIQSFTTSNKGEFIYQTNYAEDRDDLEDYVLFLPDERQFIDLTELRNIESHVYAANRYGNKEGETRLQTMTDRAIYRPGQAVHFKSILYNSHALLGKVLEKEELRAYLHDVNNQKIDSVILTTNGFGSAHGTFQLPTKTLAGSFRIVTWHNEQQISTHRFRVEEYKRPTFKVNLETNKETYTLKDSAVFTGLAETLSGAPLAGAAVRYKVNFYHFLQRKSIVFADTTIVADDKGKFRLIVPLMDSVFADLTDFTLQYTAEVVNQTGEMQAASSSYRFSTKPWNIHIQTAQFVEEKRWKEIHIRTQNQNGQPLKFSGKVDIYKYTEPKAVLTPENERYFRDVAYHVLSETEYQRYFPNYFDPILLHKETPKTHVVSYEFDSRDTGLVQIDSNLFANGRYWVEAYSIQEGDTIRSSTLVNIYKAATRKVSANEFLSYHTDKEQYNIGDKVTLTFQTDVPHAQKLFLFQSHNGKKEETKVLDWKAGEAQYSFVLQKENISPNLLFEALLVVDNKAASARVSIPIQRTDKSLSIKTVTFRDKITPGQREKWSFTILHNTKTTDAEVLATMYDSALDAFAGNFFPSTLGLNYPFYGHLSFYYLLREFQLQQGSTDIFHKHQWHDAQGNAISIVHSYGLWHMYGPSFRGGESYLDEVVVVGLGSQARRTGMVGSVAVEKQSSDNFFVRGTATSQDIPLLYVIDGEVKDTFDINNLNPDQIASFEILKDAAATAVYGSRGANGVILITTKEGQKKQAQLDAVTARANLQETAFFYPELYTDADGNISFEFDSPEALSRWKLLLFAHGKNLEAGSATFFTQTQKQLMVRPNLPRYFREGDRIILKAQIQNISKGKVSGNARIEIINPENNQNISTIFLQESSTKPFEIAAENNGIVQWQLLIPAGYPTVQIKIVAATDEFSDGEQHELPVLPNKVLVSDTEKIILKPNQQKDYQINSIGKDNLHAKVQVQTNPILEILGALDYLKNYPYECTEQTASKWFALQMALYIRKQYPAIADYFKTLNQENSKGKLEENSALSELTLEEMPWLRDIKGETEKRKAIAQLFDSNIQANINELESKLGKSQMSGGAFPWFEGGKPNTAISIRILEIAGKVLYLDPSLISTTMRQSMQKLIGSLDKDSTLFDAKRQTLQTLDYLYARHYWNGLYKLDEAIPQKLSGELLKSPEVTARSAAGIAAKAWVVNQLMGDAKQSGEIKNRITQEVIYDKDRGMYWESNSRHFNAISLHGYMVEAYKLHDPGKLQEITQWIYYSKQANHWRTTWMTVDAIYALLSSNNPADFSLENTIKLWVDKKEVATENIVLGQSNKDFSRDELQNGITLSIQNNNNRTVYGSVVQQYFAPVQEISASTKAISVQKQYYVEREGKWIEANEARLGEKIKVRVTIINDSPLEYVHLKDARPSGVEPVYRPSGYQWWQGGYYFTMKDASTNYFFDYLPKGKREFEYEVKANNAGVFNSGITTVECMYDPAVNARSANIVMTIKE